MATKIKSVFFCQECGYESSKWMGQCPGCRQWNTFVEETVKPKAEDAPKVEVAPKAEVKEQTVTPKEEKEEKA